MSAMVITPDWRFLKREEGRHATFTVFRDYRLKAEKVIMSRVGACSEALQPLVYYELDANPKTFYSQASLLTAWHARLVREWL
jgi:hypothetical protein